MEVKYATMRIKPQLNRSVLAAAGILLSACATPEPQTPSSPPPRGPAGSGARPEGARPGPNGGKPKPPPPGPKMSPDEAMSRVDANRDGAITLQEQMSFAVREADGRFSKMDRDNDGRLTAKEIDGAEKHRQSLNPNGGARAGNSGPPAGGRSMLNRSDANGDGTVDASENRAAAQEQASKRFAAGDKNGDGRLERSEMQMRPTPGQ